MDASFYLSPAEIQAGQQSGTTAASNTILFPVQASQTPAPVKSTPPAPGSAVWETYWKTKDPKAWALVWDDSVKQKATFYDNLKTNTPVYYTFNSQDSQASYAKAGYLSPIEDAAQKANVRKALDELTKATGVQFVESTQKGLQGGMVISLADLGSSTYGEHQVASVNGKVQHTVMLNSNWYGNLSKNTGQRPDPLNPGGTGYEALLHELAHTAGLDDANTGHPQQLGVKYPQYDDLKYTIMAYGGDTTNSKYTALDKKAFDIIYPPSLRPGASLAPGVTAGSPVLFSGLSGAMDEYEYDDEAEDALLADAGGPQLGGTGKADPSVDSGHSVGDAPPVGGEANEASPAAVETLASDSGGGSEAALIEDLTAEFKLKWPGFANPAGLLAPGTGASPHVMAALNDSGSGLLEKNTPIWVLAQG